MERRNQLITLRPSLAREGCILRSKPAKRREKKKSRSAGGIMETAHDSMENSMLGNPIDENTL